MEQKFKIGDKVWVYNPERGIEYMHRLCTVMSITDDGRYTLDYNTDVFSEGELMPASAERVMHDTVQVSMERWQAGKLKQLGILDTSVRSYNRGSSDYSRHLIQPWTIWLEYGLNPWDADIVKRILRTKEGDSRRLDYEKIIHICEERIRQIEAEGVS